MMEGRRLIRLSAIHQKTRSIDMEGDWVTMGVIVSKTDPKVSSKASVIDERCFIIVWLFVFTILSKGTGHFSCL